MESYIFESIEHNKNFPLKVFLTAIESSSFHWHYDYEFILVLKGSVIIHSGTEQNTLKEGDIVLLNSKSIHALKRTNDDNICLFLQIHPDLFEDEKNGHRRYQFFLNSSNPDIRISTDYSVFIKSVANIGYHYNLDSQYKKYRIQAYACTLIADLFEYTNYNIKQYAQSVTTYENPELFLKIISFIEQNHQSDTMLTDLCKTVGMSQQTVYRFLKNQTGLTIHDIIRSHRIEKAKMMLKSTEKSITFISQECGFSNEMTFYRSFKKETELTPNEYRQSGSNNSGNPNVRGYLKINYSEALRLLQKYR